MIFTTDECHCETCTIARNEVQSTPEEPAHEVQRRVPRYEEQPGFVSRLTADRLKGMAEKGEELVQGADRTATEFLADLANRPIVTNDERLGGPPIRRFTTGATRDVDTSKHDYDGFISPLVLEAYGTYMNYNRLLADGSRRESDNWQKGIPLTAYTKSGWRHFIDWWRISRGYSAHENLVWAIGGLMFNAMGYLHESLKADPDLLKRCLEQMEERRASAKRTT